MSETTYRTKLGDGMTSFLSDIPGMPVATICPQCYEVLWYDRVVRLSNHQIVCQDCAERHIRFLEQRAFRSFDKTKRSIEIAYGWTVNEAGSRREEIEAKSLQINSLNEIGWAPNV